MEAKKFQDLLICRAQQFGFEACEVYFKRSTSFGCEIQEKQVAKIENCDELGIAFRGKWKGKIGSAYSESFEEEDIAYLIKEASENAEILELEETIDFYSGSESYPVLPGVDNALEQITATEKVQKGMELEAYAINTDERVKAVDTCVIETGKEFVSIKNTEGLWVSHESNHALGYVSVIAESGQSIKTGGQDWCGRHWNEFKEKEIAEKAAEKALSHLHAKTISPGTYPVVLTNEVMGDIIATFCSVFYGENVQKGFSLLNGKLGKKVACESVTIRDDGLLEDSVSSVPFDSEGVHCQNKVVIENGILRTFLYHRLSAKKDNTISTGNGFRSCIQSPVQTCCTNFYLCPGDFAVKEMIEKVEKGVMITEIAGLHAGANAVSGDFSLSAEGFLILNGKQEEPIEQITVAGNFYQLLQEIAMVGSDLIFAFPHGNGRFGAPSVLVQGLRISG
ncbi:MAG: TldD/PmbA family protein [Clostridiales bacterium]|nr:TldD/PmbA family protein [Clostridiales bacterium]